MSYNHKGFVVMQFGRSFSEEAESFWESIFINIFKPALEEALKNVFCLTDTPEVIRGKDSHTKEELVHKLLEDLFLDSYVIADITGNNPDVMWEIGVRKALRGDIMILRMDESYTEHNDFIEHLEPPTCLEPLDILKWHPEKVIESKNAITKAIIERLSGRKGHGGLIGTFLNGYNLSRINPTHKMFETFCHITQLFHNIDELLKSPFDGPIQSLFQNLLKSQVTQGVAHIHGTAFTKFMAKAYSNTKSIRATSVKEFEYLWSEAYGKSLLESSANADPNHKERLFLGYTKLEKTQKKKLFDLHKKYKFKVRIVPKKSVLDIANNDLRELLIKHLPVDALDGIDINKLMIDLMIVDDIAGGLVSLPPVNGQIKDLGGVFFHKAGEYGKNGYDAFKDIYSHLKRNSEEV